MKIALFPFPAMNPTPLPIARRRRCATYELIVVTPMALRETAFPSALADSPMKAHAYWAEHVATTATFDPMKEHSVVLLLNTRRSVLAHHVVSVGTLDSCLVFGREVFRPAIVAAAAAIVLMHNHPSGDPTPSAADLQVTRKLVDAGKLLGIELVDHVVVGSPSPHRIHPYCSLRELGHFH